ncbi:hypothetical protein ACLB2K_029016 [Fragaria x ananassa]
MTLFKQIRLFIKKQRGVRKGYVPLLIGQERKKYYVPLKYLLYPTLQELIKNQPYQDVYDPRTYEGPLALPCIRADSFDQLLKSFKKV